MDNQSSPYEIPRPTVRRRWTAMLSLIAGLLSCLPPLSFAALIIGVHALRSREPQVGGRAAAWGGIALSLPGFLMIGFFIYTSIWMSRSTVHFAESFIAELSSDQVEAARSQCDSGVTVVEVKAWAAHLKSLVPPIKMESTSPMYESTKHGSRSAWVYRLEVTVTDANSKKQSFEICLIRSDGAFHVFNFQPSIAR